MKTKSFISFAVCVAVSVLMCSCSNEESADSNSNGQLTAFTGGICLLYTSDAADDCCRV